MSRSVTIPNGLPFFRMMEALSDPMHLALVKSINEVGHAMGKKTIAEFVENKKILKKLGELGVDFAQGYGVAKPNLMIEGVADELLLN